MCDWRPKRFAAWEWFGKFVLQVTPLRLRITSILWNASHNINCHKLKETLDDPQRGLWFCGQKPGNLYRNLASTTFWECGMLLSRSQGMYRS